MCSEVKECLSWSGEESVCACLCVNFCPSVYVSKIAGASFPNLTSCVTMSLDLGSSLGLQRQHFPFGHNIHHRLCSSLFKLFFIPLRCDSTPGGDLLPTISSTEYRGETETVFFFPLIFFFCTNYQMCDLGAWLPVMCSLWFILSFNLSSNLFATAVSQQ